MAQQRLTDVKVGCRLALAYVLVPAQRRERLRKASLHCFTLKIDNSQYIIQIKNTFVNRNCGKNLENGGE